MSIKSILCAGFVMLTLTACGPEEVSTAPPFDAALAKHFDSISNRDLDAFISTITSTDNLPLIFPDGNIMTTREEVIAFHKAWFEDDKWEMEREIIGTFVKDSMAIATVRYAYKDTPDGDVRYAFLGLVFAIENGEWRLIHDQNTRIQG